MQNDIAKYRKIYIIGAIASGKTSLGKRLSKELGIPCFELDVVRWNHKTKKRRPEAERDRALSKILSENPAWIIDGAQAGEWTEKVWQACDIAVMPHAPVAKRLFRIFKRHIKGEEGKRLTIIELFRYTFKSAKFNPQKFQALAAKYGKNIVSPDFFRL